MAIILDRHISLDTQYQNEAAIVVATCHATIVVCQQIKQKLQHGLPVEKPSLYADTTQNNCI